MLTLPGQNVYFWLNHPIRFVYVVGLVVGITNYDQRVIVTLDDGSGSCIEATFRDLDDVVVNIGIEFSIHVGGKLLEIGQVVKAKGTVSEFRDIRQIVLKRIALVNSTSDEVAAWTATAQFEHSLSQPWVLTEVERSAIDAKLRRDSERSAKKLRARRRHSDKVAQEDSLLSELMDAGAIV